MKVRRTSEQTCRSDLKGKKSLPLIISLNNAPSREKFLFSGYSKGVNRKISGRSYLSMKNIYLKQAYQAAVAYAEKAKNVLKFIRIMPIKRML
jgi:hypothetical protein